jgi:hypothetical protein
MAGWQRRDLVSHTISEPSTIERPASMQSASASGQISLLLEPLIQAAICFTSYIHTNCRWYLNPRGSGKIQYFLYAYLMLVVYLTAFLTSSLYSSAFSLASSATSSALSAASSAASAALFLASSNLPFVFSLISSAVLLTSALSS